MNRRQERLLKVVRLLNHCLVLNTKKIRIEIFYAGVFIEGSDELFRRKNKCV